MGRGEVQKPQRDAERMEFGKERGNLGGAGHGKELDELGELGELGHR
jgi:hypothetical protein